MKRSVLRIVFGIAALLFPVIYTGLGASGAASGRFARITMADGSSRMARIEGVGCSVSICSRTMIVGKGESQTSVKTPLDSIAEIRDTTPADALFVMKDGSRRRLSLVKDFRVIYLAGERGGADRLDLAQIKSVDFTSAAK